jgi:nucleoside-triphosphatase THEP1
MSTTTRTLLLTGKRGAGKTTACLRLRARALAAGLSCGGFLTIPVLEPGGRRLGLDLLDAANGERRWLASCIQDLGGPRIGPYAMRSTTLDWGIERARRGCGRTDLLFLDEIGPLEVEHGHGFAPLRELLATRAKGASLLVVRPSLVERVAAEWGPPGAQVLELTASNRHGAPAELLDRLFPGPASRVPAGVA